MKLFFLALSILVNSAAYGQTSAVNITENYRDIVMENGLVRLTIVRQGGEIRSLQCLEKGKWLELGGGRAAMYFDANGGAVKEPTGASGKPAKAGYFHPLSSGSAKVLIDSPEAGEVAITGEESAWFPFTTEAHYRLARGESGYHIWAIYRHGIGMAAAGLGEARFVIRSAPGTGIFMNHIVDEDRKGPYPTSPQVGTIQDATYRLADGSIYTKYDNSAYLAEHHVHGMAGNSVGIWMISPSNEYIGGGPVKQELTVHMDNVLLAMLVGGHFGSGGVNLADNESWSKLYGPLFVYINHGPNPEAQWQDAKLRASKEITAWPYAWLKHPDYPLERGSVTGKVRIPGDARGAWAILASPGQDWTQLGNGYDFWSRVNESGTFSINKVRPGKYTLFLSGANQFEDYKQENVEVTAGKQTDIGVLNWKPVTHGAALWQIGTADRTSAEFKGGDNYRHYGNFLRYPTEFPDDVNYVVGKSDPKQDWNFAQWSWYSKKPYWTIKFINDRAIKGQCTLTIGFASVEPPRGRTTNLQVKVNGQEISVVHLAKSGPAGYRSGCQDSVYNVVYLPFDAALLKPGENEITLGHKEALPFSAPEDQRRKVFGEVMYDAIRLEVK